MDDFARHLLRAGVCEPERWRPPAVSCLTTLTAWSGQSGSSEGTVNPQGPTANVVGPTGAKQFFFTTPRRIGASCTRTWKARRILGQVWAWTMPKQSCLKSQPKTPTASRIPPDEQNKTRTTTIRGKNQKNDLRLMKKALPPEESPAPRRRWGPTSWMQRTR